MKIRDIEKYIKERLRKHNWFIDQGKLGTDEEPFLRATFGDEQKVDGLMKRVLEIATNAEEQIFYELVQNAHDAGATSLYFYVSGDYMLVINNGRAFETSKEKESGSLFSFLAFNKSEKSAKDTGEKGIGSKTLYTLISEVNDKKRDFDLLNEAIKEGNKGPYLISWKERNQLDCLLNNRSGWDSTGDDNDLLFIKILFCYYPVTPRNEEINRFKIEEADDVVKFLKDGIEPISNLAFLEQGTALIIPLGKGKYGRIKNKEASIKRNLELFQYMESSIKDIQYCQEKIKIDRREIGERSVNWDDEGGMHQYKFIFNKTFADKKTSNLFKGLPIVETKAGLGFLVDSKDFELEGSRQRVSNTEKTGNQLKTVFKKLLTKINRQDLDFDKVYEAILETDLQQTPPSFDYIKNPFKEVFEGFLRNYVQTENGQYVNAENAIYFDDENQHLISLPVIGIKNKSWVSESIKEKNEKHDIQIPKWSFNKVLSNCDKRNLEEWLKRLSASDYKDLFEKIIDRDKDTCSEYKLFKTNKGNFFSYEKLKNPSCSVLMKSKTIGGPSLGDVECVVYPVKIEDEAYINLLVDKLKSNIPLFRENIEDAASIIKWILEHDESKESDIKGIPLFKNLSGDYTPLSDAIGERPDNTSVFDRFVVNMPQDLKDCNLVLNPNGREADFWDWIFEKKTISWNSFESKRWSLLSNDKDWRMNGVEDLKTVYRRIPEQKRAKKLKKSIDNSESEQSKELLPLVEMQKDTEVVSKFCEKISDIRIDKKIDENDYDWRIIRFAEFDTSIKDIIFRKILYINSSLPESISTSKIYVNNHVYELSELSEKYKNREESLADFFNLIPDSKWFKELFYAGKENQSVKASEVYSEIKDKTLSVEQLKFCLDYSLNNEADNKDILKEDLRINEGDVVNALNMIEKNSFMGFDRYFKLNYSKEEYENKYYVKKPEDADLLLENERLDEEFVGWIRMNDKRVGLFERLKTDRDDTIEIRKGIKENKYVDIKSDKNNKIISWVIQKPNYNVFTRKDNRYKVLKKIVSKDYSFKITVNEESKVKYSLSRIASDKVIYLNAYEADFEDWIEKDEGLKRIVKTDAFYLGDQEYYNYKLIKEESGELKSEEWNNKTYREYKADKENHGKFCIYVSDEPIKIDLKLMNGDKRVWKGLITDGDCWVEKEKVYVKADKNKWKEVLRIISEHTEELNKEMSQWVLKLQTYLINNESGGNGDGDISIEKSQLDKETAQKVVNNISPQVAENVDELNDILKRASVRELWKLIKYNEEKNEEESDPDKIVGDIGEYLYKKYLEKKGIKPQEQESGNCDFFVKKENDEYHIDIKTNNKTLTDGNAPFYIHRSQDDFLKENPDSKFFLIRISLPDLGISRQEGKAEDIAEMYWKTHSVEEFENKIREYNIKRKEWQGDK